MTAVDATSTDGPARFAEVALKMGLPLGFAVDMWASSDLVWKSSTGWCEREDPYFFDRELAQRRCSRCPCTFLNGDEGMEG